MTLQNLSKILDKYDQQFGLTDIQQLDLLNGLSFYSSWDGAAGKSSDFNRAIGLPKKNSQLYPLYDYERLLFNTLREHKHV
jgi:hypothetical protein